MQTLPVRIEWILWLLGSHMDAPDCPSLATQLCCRMLAQACRQAMPFLRPLSQVHSNAQTCYCMALEL